MQRTTLLEYKNYRDLKASLLLMAIAILAYVFHHPELGPYGGTWLGYTLGTIGAAITLVLLWFGVYKRRIPVQKERRKVRDHSSSSPETQRSDRRVSQPSRSRHQASTRQGWLSVHIYFGLSLIIVITLHTGFDFGWNVPTLAYGLMLCVILTGLYGVYCYILLPSRITENLGDETRDALLEKISRLNEQAVSLANQLPPEIKDVVRIAAEQTRIGGSAIEQLKPDPLRCPTSIAVKQLHDLGKDLDATQFRVYRELYSTMLKKEALVNRTRRDMSLRARLDVWLYLHVPLAIALVVAVIAHVFSIFFYW